jgi:hypothetical protein
MSLSVDTKVNSPIAQQNVRATRDMQGQTTQRSSGDQDRIPDGGEKRRDAVTLTPSRNPTSPGAEARIQSAGVASEAANRAKTRMIEQPAAAIVAQAHATPQAVLALLRA